VEQIPAAAPIVPPRPSCDPGFACRVGGTAAVRGSVDDDQGGGGPVGPTGSRHFDDVVEPAQVEAGAI